MVSSWAPVAALACRVSPGSRYWFCGRDMSAPWVRKNMVGMAVSSPPPCTFTPFGPPFTSTTYCEPAFQRWLWMTSPGLSVTACALFRMVMVPRSACST